MACSACARRRKALEAKRRQQAEQGNRANAAALGAVLALSAALDKIINGEVEDGQSDGSDRDSGGSAEPDS